MSVIPKNFLLINKPVGWTSFDVVGYIRGALKKTNPTLKNIKVGHAGTLDPFATGLLIIGVGREATKHLDDFKGLPKTYIATLHLGATSDTQDVMGTITQTSPSPTTPTADRVTTLLQTFIGEQQQLPPMYSAKQVGGVRLYKLARAGKEVERQPATIHIYSAKLIAYAWPLLTIEITCSAGTYIRTIGHDIGQQLGTGAYCEALTRISIGDYHLDQAATPDQALTKIAGTFTL